ncbi:MAG: CoB--CoM heterodisulfide reductase iron-sulfur subunit A family protein [Proteobacteria bacterium]|nr:CoB--CoM heterodisulfide reductase iron-sulfur subunit A family protein [Pseudomonadota bacterium]MBU1715470.1 CoB--CoM heterodisulfide reductase iron-sulfur subunit A family protein [Pseudomonadota bacterium]
MSTRVYLCKCGTNIAAHLNLESLATQLQERFNLADVVPVDFLCSEEGKDFLQQDLTASGADRFIFAACSPRDHDHTFREALTKSGFNPYLQQMVNIREQVAWVTADPAQAEAKALALISAAIGRVSLHQPLSDRELAIVTDTLVIGAGPAGMKCALTLAEAGRQVVLVEKSPAIGGKPVLFEEVAPDLQCGPCLLEPMMEELLHGSNAHRIQLLTLAKLTSVKGSYGNFITTIRQRPRRIDPTVCIGCYECIAPCPVNTTDTSAFQIGRAKKNAIAFAFQGVLPNAPYIDNELCLRSNGEDCSACLEACPMDNAVILKEEEKLLEKKVGAIVVATGGDLFDPSALAGLGYRTIPDVITSFEFERLTSANGPTGGQLLTEAGITPTKICIIHCAGSLEKQHIPYCSGICCTYALKFSRMIAERLPETIINHLFKELVLPGKAARTLADKVHGQPNTSFHRFTTIDAIRITDRDGRKVISTPDGEFAADLVILCPPIIPGKDAGKLSKLLDLPLDRDGFFEEAGDRLDSARSKVKGIYLAGNCQGPNDIRDAVNQGMAAAGYILAGLVEGRNLSLSPIVATVDPEKCSGCRVCGEICPFMAIDLNEEDGKSQINDVLCQGCGSCVAACPAGAISGRHFTSAQIMAELEGILS